MALSLVGLGACRGPGGLSWAESKAPEVRVNQVGYFPKGPKWATVRSERPEPLPVRLKSADGRVVFKGMSVPRGLDAASGERVHQVDFSNFQGTGTGFALEVGEAESFPFDVRANLYERLKFDALKYFYHNRSGTPIVEPYVDDRTWSRPAGHLSDTSVPCWKDCDYALDVSGGWYDAGDHGKYVVNGGISVWTLLNLYETAKYLGKGRDAFGDGPLRIPESGNGVPDVLDEARWEIEFLLKMQIPTGLPFAGMAHHKIHDDAWSALGIEPPRHAMHRALHPPSTAATLNLAAIAAQAARIWKDIDPSFSERCLRAAHIAWAAARKYPEKFAPKGDNKGGGPYDDDHVDDEFYWAAAEIFVTTGDPALGKFVENHPEARKFPIRLDGEGDGPTTSMTWQGVLALGWISMAVVPNRLPEQQIARLRQGIVEAGDAYLDILAQEGYRTPLGTGKDRKYPWGSNSLVLNNMVVMGLAYDFTKDRKYAAGVAEGMDYLLGRNPMVQSYVTGYGSIPLKRPHHRFWSESYKSNFPPPPPGAISGGPNSSLQDPQTRKSGLSRDLPPQKCFVDHIEAWSVNEITINWNAPFAWTAAFLDEWRGG